MDRHLKYYSLQKYTFLLRFCSPFYWSVLYESVSMSFHQHWLDVSLSAVLLFCPFIQQTSSSHHQLNQHLIFLAFPARCFLFIRPPCITFFVKLFRLIMFAVSLSAPKLSKQVRTPQDIRTVTRHNSGWWMKNLFCLLLSLNSLLFGCFLFEYF